MRLKEPPICSLTLGQCSKAAPAEGGVKAALCPSFPSHLLPLTTWALEPMELGFERLHLQAK